MAQYIGERTAANQWKSQMFNKYQDMVLIRGEDRTDGIQYMEYDENLKKYIVYFTVGEVEHCRLEDIIRLQYPESEIVKDKRIYIGDFQISKVSRFLYFGDYMRIIYKNGDYQTVSRNTMNVCDKFNKIEKNAYKPYTYNLFPNERQKENIDHLIKESQVEEKKAGIVYSYEPDKPIGSIIKYKDQKAYVDIMDVGEVEADMFDYPVGNCHDIHVKKVSGVYRITFYCYKRVVGIDLGERAVICSTGEKFELPQIELKKQSKYWEIKQQWKESVAMQLLLDYDILFLEYLENDGNTRQGFEDMITFSNVLVEKAEIFNKGNPKESYKKEIYKLKSKYPSTQICHICGYQNEDLVANLQKRNWMCPYCGTKHDRDINAAINILRHGMEEKILNNKMEENELTSIDLSKVHFDVTLD